MVGLSSTIWGYMSDTQSKKNTKAAIWTSTYERLKKMSLEEGRKIPVILDRLVPGGEQKSAGATTKPSRRSKSKSAA